MSGIDWTAQQKAMHDWVVAGTGLPPTSIVWGQQDSPRPAFPGIVMRISNIAEIGRMFADQEDQPLTFTTKTVTGVDTTVNTLTVAAHGLLTGDGPIQIASTLTLPSPLQVNTNYWVVATTINTISLATSYHNTGGGQGSSNPITTIDLTTVGSGTITVADTSDTVRAGAELSAISRGYIRVTLELRCHAPPGTGDMMATSILQRIRTRRMWPTQLSILRQANIGLIDVERVRAIQGIRDALLFEPRAYCDVTLNVVAEESENLTIITSAEISSVVTGQDFTVSTGNGS